MWKYFNPVNIRFGAGGFDSLGELVANRSYGLVTYPDDYFRELVSRVENMCGQPSVLIGSVNPNPNFLDLSTSCAEMKNARKEVEVLIALGGGSVIDAAKVIAASRGNFALVQRYLTTRAGAELLGNTPIIALPTTAGTGSEVTCWATVWDLEGGRKFSLARPSLYAESTLVDPALMLGLPLNITISTALDALSHAMESIWNLNANPVSTQMAVFAAKEILEYLPRLVDHLQSIDLRSRIARAATFAGLAFSNTQSALAHSLSYQVTIDSGTPHGIACSFTLPMVMRWATGVNSDCDAALRRIFGQDLEAGARRLEEFLFRLGISVDPSSYGFGEQKWKKLLGEALNGARGKNFLVSGTVG